MKGRGRGAPGKAETGNFYRLHPLGQLLKDGMERQLYEKKKKKRDEMHSDIGIKG